MESLTFQGHDRREVEACLGVMYSPTRIGTGDGHAPTRISRRVLTREVAFDELEYGSDVGFDADAPAHLVLCDVVTDTVRLDGIGGGQVFGPGDIFVICRPGLPYAGVVRSARLRQLTLDPVVLTQAASNIASAREAVCVTDQRPASQAAVLNLRRAIAYVRNHVLAVPGAVHEPLVAATACQYLGAQTLETFPNTAVVSRGGGEGSAAGPGALRRAVSFIEGNPDIDLSIADIARAASVTPRALQLSFRRHLDTTPMAYLRRIRLECAHHDLSVAGPGGGATVTEVAFRWGFVNAGRFARHYREAYGGPPSATLRS